MADERVVLRRRHSAQVKALVLEQCAVPGALGWAISWLSPAQVLGKRLAVPS